jgi:ABC-2 type transport system ATP-binding protein
VSILLRPYPRPVMEPPPLAPRSVFTTREQTVDIAAIAVAGLRRTFGDTVAVDDLSFEIAYGEVFGLLGHNGAGKTTTIRLMNGILAPDSGSVRTLGRDPHEDGRWVRSRTGVLTAQPSLDEHLTVREVLRVYGGLYALSPDEVDRRIGELGEVIGLSDYLDLRTEELSTGMRQRVALARALIHGPDLVLLDEATASVDPIGARTIRRLVRELSEERARTIVFATHNLAEAQEVCDRVAVMSGGRLLALGAPDELAEAVGARPRLDILLATGSDVAAAHRLVSTLHHERVLVADSGWIEVVGADRHAAPELIAALVRDGHGIHQVVETAPALEDIYVELHRREGVVV